jgi:periplasmic divalent cation tolerance protein
METDCIVVFTTVATLDEARRMARSLVEKKLVACAQISEIESFYHWDGAVQNDKEYRLLLKTTKGRYAAVERAITQMHSYDLPAVHALTVAQMSRPYADWIESEIRGESA